MLIGSHHRAAHQGLVTNLGGSLFVHTAKTTFNRTGRTGNRIIADGGLWNDGKSAVPAGYLAPYARYLPRRSGGLGSTGISGTGTLVAAGNMGVNLQATLAGAGSLTGAAGLIVSAAATLLGTGTIADADARAYLQAAATLAGSGSVSAGLEALGQAVAVLSGSGTLTTVVEGPGSMSATITPFTELSPQGLAQAVWSAVADSFTDLTTVGGQARFMYLLAHHKVITDPTAGTITVYDTDGTTVLYVADVWEDAAAGQSYRGQGADRRDEFA